jgi:cytochrome c5
VSVTRKSLLALSLSALCVALVATPAGAAVKDEIAARLQPAGVSCVFGEACAAGLKVPGAENLAPRSGEEVYGTFCQACHASGANNAPLFANAEAWAPRIAKGIDALYDSGINGFNNGAMPVRGTCVNCSDDEIKAAVDHMVAAAEPK